MRAKFSLLALILIASPLGIAAQGAWQLGERLAAIKDYRGDAVFEVYLPSAEDPVTYNIALQSSLSAEPDSLAPCDYLIRWSTMSKSGPLEGFSAYFDGNHYRLRNSRLQEYHYAESPLSFRPQGPGSELKHGVQCNAQFADLLPQMLGCKIMEIASDTSYIYAFHPDTLVSGARRIVVDGVKRAPSGYDVAHFTYVFDKETGLPLLADLENSPGTISEQLVTVTYKTPDDAQMVALTEEGLVAAFPDAFERFRESTFRAESLVGAQLPAFSSQIANSQDRYSHHTGEPLGRTSIFVVLDPDVATTPATMQAVRDAAAQLPQMVDIFWAFKTNKEDEVADLIADIGPGETALMSASSLIRNAGVTLFPTILICSSSGQVADVMPGYNNNIAEIVIQKASVAK